MKNTSLKQKLKNKELTIGSWITIGHPAIVEVLATANFDWLTIDIEHNSFDPSMVQQLISIIQAYDIAALVRVNKNEEVVIKNVMDAGADGVIVPMVCSKADAEKAVAFVKYPPEGKRGVGLSRAQNYGVGFEDYKKWLKESAVVIAQIEHYQGVDNIQEIISTPGIDGVIVGPYDLSGSMGYPGEFQREEVKTRLESLKKVCLTENFPMGYHVVPVKNTLMNEAIEEGYTFIAYSTDFLFLGDTVRKQMNNIINSY